MLGASQCVYAIIFYKADSIQENERLIHLDLGKYIISKS